MSLYVKYLVCYDISNTRTRSKFFDFLKDLGLTPIQKSVFFGDLKTPEVRSLKAAAEKWLDASCDSCLYFPCHLNLKTVESTLSQIRRRRARGTSGLWPSSP